LGSFIDSAESSYGYDNRDPVNRNRATNRFGNVNFIFTDLTDGNYWIVVEQINHLPIMSRFAAPFKYEGDDRSTWAIESGWDFESWNGIDDNLLAGPVVNPWLENNYTAYGDAVSTYNNPRYSTTGLIYNNGVAGGSVNPMPAMVAGDVQHDGIINAADRVRVRLDDGTSLVRSDVTGDGVTNADDRTITDRNFGKVSSLYNVVYQKSSDKTDPFGMISELDPEMSRRFNDAAKNPRQIKTDKHKENITQASFNYEVSAVTEVNDKYIDLKMYIRNKGADFALANATFAVTYNTSSLKFVSLVGQEEVIFSNKPEKGYATLRSAPEANAQNPLPNVRTIEVDYDAYAMLDGEPVPSDLTYLGTLRFEFKNKSGTASFAWHYSTSVHTTKGEVVTEFGEFKEIEKILLYTAQLTTPNGGESYSPNKKYNISWNTTSAATAYLEYSIDQGSTWNRVSQDTLLVETKSYQWTIPDVSSIKCLVRLIDAETGIELDRSDNVFAIVPNFAQITRPSSGDPVYTGGSTDKIIWSSKGYNYVKFEFSYDGGVNNWTSVSTKILADNATDCNWKIPTVTTKSAVVRMLDAETGQEITRTGMFRVLAGSIAFRNPRESEVLVINRQTRIRWNSSGISQFDIDISLDGGYSWQNIATDVAALKTYLDWDIPNDIDYVSDEAILRALWNGDPEMEYCRTGLFTITSIGDVNDNAINAGEFGFIYPNPCSHNAIIEFYLPIEQKVEILLYNNMGQVVKNLSSKYYTPGNNTINININNMSSGAYYLNFKTETFNIIRDLYIIK
ncbi:MAG: Dockerin protein, partial [Bacteroidota bacterium]|nr:Dockerin protein [Bacteroidota bacterium]